MSAAPAAKYGADDLTHLEGLEAVRKRPGMYIGSTGSTGINHCIWEIIDNAVDEAIAGHCTRIEVTLHADGSIEVADNGRGIPVDTHLKTKLSGVELVLTKLHAGGKFGGSNYASAGGLHGVGASVVNALSQRLNVTVYRDGTRYDMSFARGIPGVFTTDASDSTFTPKSGIHKTGKAPAKHTGTTIRFWPDRTIFHPDAAVDPAAVLARARQTAFLVPGLTINVRNLTTDPAGDESFAFAGGIADMVDFLSAGKPVADVLHFTGTGSFTETVPVLDSKGHMTATEVERDVHVDVAVKWDTGYDTNVQSFVNVVATPKGGTHLKGFERGLVTAIRKSIDGTRLMKANEPPVTLDDALEGLTAVVSVGFPEPQFEGQTKEVLGTPGVTKIVQEVVTNGLTRWLEGRGTKVAAKRVLEKVAAAARVRVTQKAQKDAARRKTALESSSMPAKLVDCRSGDTDRNEVFIVEGDSALGTAKSARNSEFQALMPIRGKILNVHKATLKQVLDNAEASSLIQIIGAGSGRNFDIDQARYGKIILMSDADVDGAHIRTLLLTLIYRYMKPMIETGRVYAAMPPLHKITTAGRDKQIIYTYDEAELHATVTKLETAGKQIIRPIPRYKGLGEMNADELWDTTMDPTARSIRRITLTDAEAADAILDTLMGEAVAPRKAFIVDNANRIDQIDA